MAFTTVKTLDERRPASFQIQYRDYYGVDGAKYVLISPKEVGVQKRTSMNKTVDYLPGRFSVNPIEQIRTETVSLRPREDVFLPGVRAGKPGLNGRLISGDIMSYMCQYSGVGFTDAELTIPTYPSTNEKYLALNGAWEKINREDFGIALWLAELRETIEMLRSPLSGFRKLWNEFFHSSRKLSKYGGKTLGDSLTSQWLEYRMGITPFILDILAILKLYEDGLTRHERTMEKATRRILDTDGEPVQYYKGNKLYSLPAHMVYISYTETRFQKRAVTARYYYRRNARLAETLARLGFSPAALLAVGWELVPYSFVVDWVFNVGQWLNSIVPAPGIDILGNTVSSKQTLHSYIVCDWATYYNDGTYPKVKVDCASSTFIEGYTRTVNNPTPVRPALQANILNLKRSVDSISLIWQNLPLKRKR